MDCTLCAEDLTAFLDDELSDSDFERIRSHLQCCDSCSEELRSLRAARDLVATHTRQMQLRPESWNRVRARINKASTTAPSQSWILNRWKFALGTLVILAALGLGYMQYQQVQRKNLDRYVSQYLQERKAQIDPLAENNPFIEVHATLVRNPFRSEDR